MSSLSQLPDEILLYILGLCAPRDLLLAAPLISRRVGRLARAVFPDGRPGFLARVKAGHASGPRGGGRRAACRVEGVAPLPRLHRAASGRAAAIEVTFAAHPDRMGAITPELLEALAGARVPWRPAFCGVSELDVARRLLWVADALAAFASDARTAPAKLRIGGALLGDMLAKVGERGLPAVSSLALEDVMPYSALANRPREFAGRLAGVRDLELGLLGPAAARDVAALARRLVEDCIGDPAAVTSLRFLPASREPACGSGATLEWLRAAAAHLPALRAFGPVPLSNLALAAREARPVRCGVAELAVAVDLGRLAGRDLRAALGAAAAALSAALPSLQTLVLEATGPGAVADAPAADWAAFAAAQPAGRVVLRGRPWARLMGKIGGVAEFEQLVRAQPGGAGRRVAFEPNLAACAARGQQASL